MAWKITYFNQKVEEDTYRFPPGILADFLHIASLIEEFGANLGSPYTKAFGNGLFEIRAKGREGAARSFFCFAKGKEIIILHSFIKKSQKTPKKEIDLALKRIKEVKT
jgi:phage-related protein